MQVVQLAKGTHWTVCAACANGGCPVLGFIEELEGKGGNDSKRGRKIFSDLTQHAPNSASSEWAATDFSKDLGDDIYEFRWNGKGGVPRVLWFYDENKVVVCVHATIKKKPRLEPQDMEIARQRRAEYFAAKAADQLEFVDIENFDGN